MTAAPDRPPPDAAATPPAQRRPVAAAVAVGWPAQALTAAVRGYRFWFKPWLGNACRFEPTCSAYALEALALHGARRGSWLAVRRLLRCHPACDGGSDPVPPPPGAVSPSPERLPSSSP